MPDTREARPAQEADGARSADPDLNVDLDPDPDLDPEPVPASGPGADAAAEPLIRPLGRPGDLGWVVMAHGEQYTEQLGWNIELEALIARIVADYGAELDESGEPPHGAAAWIAELDGRRVGCVFCVRQDEETAKLRILLVDAAARGRGLGAMLVGRCVDFARSAGYRRMRLWTNHPLVSARRIYLAVGFRLIEEEPHHSFGVDLVGQTYELSFEEREPGQV